ncbi:MAG: polysaccharide biosynthesis/export family protein, partial [Cellvibrionaceae bacterium]
LSACGGTGQTIDSSSPSAAAASANTTVAKANTGDYRVGAGDTVSIAVTGESELTMDVLLNDGGTFSYPYLGQLTVLGMTLSEIQQMLTEKLSQGYLVDPKVSVSMNVFRQIYVGGEVAQGGDFAFQPGLTVGKAVVLAGGFTDRASRTRIYVVSEGAQSSKPVKVSLDYVLKPGDVITVQRRFF